MSQHRFKLSIYHTVILLLASTAYFGIRVLEIYWTEYGRTDADHMWGAGLAARHGTLRYIQDVGDIRDPSTWRESELFKRDPEAFRAMIRPPGYLVLFDYPPVFAIFLMPFSYLDKHSFAALWWLIAVMLYLFSIWRVIPDLKTKFLFSAVALHFPPFLKHLEFGSTLIIVMGLCLCYGSFGIALAGWFKLFPWSLAWAKDGRPKRVLLWIVLLGLLGYVWTQLDIRPFYVWAENLQQHQKAGGLSGSVTWLRVGLACPVLLWAMYKKWHPALTLAVAQLASPVWWPWYWCIFVPAVGLGCHVLVQRVAPCRSIDPDRTSTIHDTAVPSGGSPIDPSST